MAAQNEPTIQDLMSLANIGKPLERRRRSRVQSVTTKWACRWIGSGALFPSSLHSGDPRRGKVRLHSRSILRPWWGRRWRFFGLGRSMNYCRCGRASSCTGRHVDQFDSNVTVTSAGIASHGHGRKCDSGGDGEHQPSANVHLPCHAPWWFFETELPRFDLP